MANRRCTESSDGMVTRRSSEQSYRLQNPLGPRRGSKPQAGVGSAVPHLNVRGASDRGGAGFTAKRPGDTPPDSNRSKRLPSNVYYTTDTLQVIFNELKGKKGQDRPYLIFNEVLRAMSRYRVDLNSRNQISKEEYISMAKFMYIQICNQAQI